VSPLGIHHVQVTIPSGGESAARAFYGGLLGMEELPKPESLRDRGGCWFRCGAQEVHCGVDDRPAGGRAHPAFLVDDLAGLRGRLNGAGVPTVDDRRIPGFTRFYCRDPFGNRLEFLEAVAGGLFAD
jgi:catechol 2,3-dioxygenase-like lactoylglutathione lyase family enzyme